MILVGIYDFRYTACPTLSKQCDSAEYPKDYNDIWRNNDLDSTEIMEECLKLVRNSDVLIFSSINLFVGKGVYTEVREAERTLKPTKLLWKQKLWDYHLRLYNRKDWMYRYGKVKPIT